MTCGNVVQLPPYFRGETFDVKSASIPYHLADTNMERHWLQTDAGRGVRVGVGDTGIDIGHPEIEGKVLGGESFVSRRAGKWDDETNGHGTHVGTTYAGTSVGVSPNVELIIAKVLGDNGAGSNQGVAEGIYYMIEAECHIINLSLGGPYDDPYTRDAIAHGKAKGVIFVIATGNERANHVGFPAQHGVGVGAVDRGLKLADFSNRGKHVDIVGYGVNLYAGLPGGRYAAWSGTSMATPFVGGIAANRLSAELKHLGEIKTRTDSDLRELETFVTDLGPEGRDTSYGRGFPDLEKAFYNNLVKDEVPPPTDPEHGALQVRVEEVGSNRRWHGMVVPERLGN